MENIIIPYNKLSKKPLEDEIDILNQVEVVKNVCNQIGYNVYTLEVDLNLTKLKKKIKKIKPSFIFNLVESIDGKITLGFIVPALFESMNIPFSGSGSSALNITSNKILTKKYLKKLGMPVPEGYLINEANRLIPNKRYIVKPFGEAGSVGIGEEGVFFGNCKRMESYIKKNKRLGLFIEEYIHGREINISILGGKKGPRIMPPAEIKYNNCPNGGALVLGYKNKWIEDSLEYQNTQRSFDFSEKDKGLLKKIEKISLDCWKKFNLRGYARVDIRIDKKNNPYIIEINANPCLSPNSGFYAACDKGGFKFEEVISDIIYDGKNSFLF